jgi:alpha-beta hydrolase superfamily lysophospholipase
MNERNGRPTEELVESVDGVRIFVRSWRPERSPRAVVVICHGVNSHG